MATPATTSTNAVPEVTTVTQKRTARTRLVGSAVRVGKDSRAMESGVKVGPLTVLINLLGLFSCFDMDLLRIPIVSINSITQNVKFYRKPRCFSSFSRITVYLSSIINGFW